MELKIACPQCGYNEYTALNTQTNQEVTIIISKCETTGFELQIIEDQWFATFSDESELQIPSHYNLLTQVFTDCLDDSSLS